MALRVRLLGGIDVDDVAFARLGSRKSRRLLARLALGRGSLVTADALVEVLWPGADRPQRPNDQLSVLVSRLRAVLGASTLPRQGRSYGLRVDWLDVDAMAELVAEARRRLAGGALAPAQAAVDAAIALDRGVLLPDEEPADWLDAERAAAHQLGLQAHLTAADVALAAGDPWTAAGHAGTARDRALFDEAALRRWMAALAASGRSAQAVTGYLEFQGRLRDELGVDPDQQTTNVYLELLRNERAAPVAPSIPTRAGLVGRAAELGRLDQALAVARQGHAELVVLRGEAGIGKTRLLDFWSERVQGATLLRAAGSELGEALPLQPVLDALAAWLRRHPDREEWLLRGTARVLAPLVGAVDSDDVTVDRTMALFGDAGRAGPSLLFAALDTVLGRMTDAEPAILVIDDSHWLDRATIAWLAHARARLADRPWLTLVASRPGEGSLPGGGILVELGPLDLAAVTELVGTAEAPRLFASSGGHPLFLMELMHTTGDAVPSSIRDAVDGRCAQTGAAAPTLRAAAVLGSDVDLDLLAAVLDESPATLLDHLEEGVRRHLLVEHGQGFRFRHHLIREALCAATGGSRSAFLHRTAARSLQARGHRADPLDVAHHARLGGDAVLASHAFAAAGEAAAARFDHDEAIRLLETALSLQDTPQLRLRRARVALPAGRFELAGSDAAVAMDAGLGAPAKEVAAIAAYLLRDLGRCRRLAQDGARTADNAALRTSCLALAGRASHVDGDLSAARRLLDQARAAAPDDQRPLAHLWSAPLWTDSGDPAGALELLGESMTAVVGRHPFFGPHRHLIAAQALGMLGQAGEALAELDRADDQAAAHRTERFAARVDNCRAWILRNLGDSTEAEARNQAAYARSVDAPGMGEPVADALLGLADGRLRAGDRAAARVHLDRVAAHLATPHPFAWRQRMRAELLDGRCRLAEGDVAGALAAAARLIARAERLGVPRYVVLARALAAAARQEPIDEAALRRFAPLEAVFLKCPA